MLFEPLTLMISARMLPIFIVLCHAFVPAALYCLWTLLSREPTSTQAWRALHPEVPCSPCRVCNELRPEDTHHCRTCDACVVEHDHHCGVLGVCIGHGNRHAFIALLAIGALGYMTLASLCVITIRYDPTNHHVITHAVAAGISTVTSLVLITFGGLQLALLATGLRLKSPRLLQRLCRALGLRCGLERRRRHTETEAALLAHAAVVGDPLQAAKDDDDDDDDVMAEPGCCACIQASHDAGLDGILPGVGTLTSSMSSDEDKRATHLRYAAAATAVVEMVIASYLLVYEPASPSLPWLAPIAIAATAWGTGVSYRLMAAFQLAASDPQPSPRYFPPSAALVPQPTGAPGQRVASVAVPNADDASEEDGWAATDSEQRLLAKHHRSVHDEDEEEMAQGGGAGAGVTDGSIAWCAACEEYVRRPSAHCRACGRCIHLMDHHCSLLRCSRRVSNPGRASSPRVANRVFEPSRAAYVPQCVCWGNQSPSLLRATRHEHRRHRRTPRRRGASPAGGVHACGARCKPPRGIGRAIKCFVNCGDGT